MKIPSLLFPVLGFTLAAALTTTALAGEVRTREVPLSSFGAEPVNRQDLQKGIQTLFSGTASCTATTASCPSKSTADSIANSAVAIQQRLGSAIAKTGRVTVKESVSRFGLAGSFQRIDFEFPSLVQSGRNGPNDTVRGVYLVPHRFSACPHPFPTAVIVHSSVDNQEVDEMHLANTLVTVTQKVGVMMIYLPHFGPRRGVVNGRLPDGRPLDPTAINDDFFVTDPTKLKMNIGQALLDLHVGIDWLRQLPSVNVNQISMIGLSFGGSFQMTYEGMNPGHVKGGHVVFVGGGDLANVISQYIKIYPDDSFAGTMQSAGWNDEVKMRKQLADIDPVTWSPRIHKTEILMINSTGDQLMDHEKSVRKIAAVLEESNHVKTNWLNSPTHAPRDLSFWERFTGIFWPIQSFLQRDAEPVPPYSCF